MCQENKTLLEKIKSLREELNRLLNEDPSDKNKILQISKYLDELIVEYYNN